MGASKEGVGWSVVGDSNFFNFVVFECVKDRWYLGSKMWSAGRSPGKGNKPGGKSGMEVRGNYNNKDTFIPKRFLRLFTSYTPVAQGFTAIP